jgi:hypothetical protein
MLECRERAAPVKKELDSVAFTSVVLLEQNLEAALHACDLHVERRSILCIGHLVMLDDIVAGSNARRPRLQDERPAE